MDKVRVGPVNSRHPIFLELCEPSGRCRFLIRGGNRWLSLMLVTYTFAEIWDHLA